MELKNMWPRWLKGKNGEKSLSGTPPPHSGKSVSQSRRFQALVLASVSAEHGRYRALFNVYYVVVHRAQSASIQWTIYITKHSVSGSTVLGHSNLRWKDEVGQDISKEAHCWFLWVISLQSNSLSKLEIWNEKPATQLESNHMPALGFKSQTIV